MAESMQEGPADKAGPGGRYLWINCLETNEPF